MRHFARLTNAHAVALHFMYYNFCRIHKTLRVTPTMAARVTDRLWTVEDIVALITGGELAERWFVPRGLANFGARFPNQE